MVISLIRIDGRSLISINGSADFEINDYKVTSSADGNTELDIKIIGKINVFELSANQEE